MGRMVDLDRADRGSRASRTCDAVCQWSERRTPRRAWSCAALRRCGLFAAAAIPALVLLGCGSRQPASDEKPRIVVYASADDAVAREVLEACSAETGIELVPVFDTEATKSTGLENRLRAERDRPRADVFWSSEGFATARLASEGVLAPMSPSSLEAIAPSRIDSGRRWVAFAARARVIVRSTARAVDPPATWWDLPEAGLASGGLPIAIADPRFGTTRGHLAALASAWRAVPPEASSAAAANAAGEAGDASRPKNASDAPTAEVSAGAVQDSAVRAADLAASRSDSTGVLDAWIGRLVARGVRVLPGGNAATVDAVVAGEALFGLTDTDDALAAIARGLPIAMSLPRTHAPGVAGGGTMLVPNTAGVVAGGPGDAAAAERVVRWLASPRCEEILCRSASRNLPLGEAVACDPGFSEPDPLAFDAVSAQRDLAELAERAALRLSAERER